MIDFSKSEEEVMLQEMAKSFAKRSLQDHIRSSEISGPEEKTVQAWNQTGLALLWESGQSELPTGALVRCLVLEELGSGDPGAVLNLLLPVWAQQAAQSLGVPEAACSDLAGLHIVEDLAQCGELIPWCPLGKGEAILCFDKAGKFRVSSVGVTDTQSLGLKATRGGRVEFGEVLVEGQSEAREAEIVIARTRLYLASVLVGLSRSALDYAANYLQERRAFSRPLSQHQGLAFMVAEMSTEIQAARMLVQRAALHLDESKTSTCAQAYLSAGESSQMVGERAVQLLGGHGYMKDHPVELWMREARALTLLWGGFDSARQDAAKDAWEEAWS